MFSSTGSKIFIHVVGWMIFFSMPVLFSPQYTHVDDFFKILVSPLLVATAPLLITFFYFNAYILVPRFFLTKKYLAYFLIATGIVIVFVFLSDFVLMQLPHHFFQIQNIQHPQGEGPPPNFHHNQRPGRLFIVPYFLFLLVWAFSTLVKISGQWSRIEKRLLKAEADKTNAELQMLKAQINPHFLFNTLNNIYSLSLAQSESTSDSILRLSKIMRYLTSEQHNQFVPLESEVDCINDYIDLQRIRCGATVDISFEVKGEIHNKKIAPLIMIPFIENAFKYGISTSEMSPIIIYIDTRGSEIFFFVKNKIFKNEHKSDSTGVGIKNVSRRLEHIYGEEYKPVIISDNGFFEVRVTVPN